MGRGGGGFEILDIPGRGERGWFVKVRTSENFLKNRNSKISQSSLKLKLEIIIDQDSNMRAFTYFYFLNVIVFSILNFIKTGIGQ